MKCRGGRWRVPVLAAAAADSQGCRTGAARIDCTGRSDSYGACSLRRRRPFVGTDSSWGVDFDVGERQGVSTRRRAPGSDGRTRSTVTPRRWSRSLTLARLTGSQS